METLSKIKVNRSQGSRVSVQGGVCKILMNGRYNLDVKGLLIYRTSKLYELPELLRKVHKKKTAYIFNDTYNAFYI